LTQFFFDLQKFVLIVAHQNEVIHIDHNEKLHIVEDLDVDET
jgi:hypothetical protein